MSRFLILVIAAFYFPLCANGQVTVFYPEVMINPSNNYSLFRKESQKKQDRRENLRVVTAQLEKEYAELITRVYDTVLSAKNNAIKPTERTYGSDGKQKTDIREFQALALDYVLALEDKDRPALTASAFARPKKRRERIRQELAAMGKKVQPVYGSRYYVFMWVSMSNKGKIGGKVSEVFGGASYHILLFDVQNGVYGWYKSVRRGSNKLEYGNSSSQGFNFNLGNRPVTISRESAVKKVTKLLQTILEQTESK